MLLALVTLDLPSEASYLQNAVKEWQQLSQKAVGSAWPKQWTLENLPGPLHEWVAF